MISNLHKKAVELAMKIRIAEAEMILILQEIDGCRGYTELGYPSLFSYASRGLGFSEATAYHFIHVSRKAKKTPSLQKAIVSGELSVAKAKVIASVITEKNAPKWLKLASDLSVRELERQVSDVNPKANCVEKIRYRGKNQVEITLTLSTDSFDLLKRAQEVLVQKKKAPVPFANLLHELAEAFLEREDPLRKAKRAEKTKERKNSAAKERHIARLRDKGECQYLLPDGKICKGKVWIDLHHIKHRAMGGNDKAENLTTLCSAHHRMVHSAHFKAHSGQPEGVVQPRLPVS